MSLHVHATGSPDEVLDIAGAYLASDPVRHNVISTVLQERLLSPAPGHYWVVQRDREVAGVGMQSPIGFLATLTPMPFDCVAALVESIAETGASLPGVSGTALPAAQFAGQWCERCGVTARPYVGARLYELRQVTNAGATGGAVRLATGADLELVARWFVEFQADTGAIGGDPAEAARVRLEQDRVWLWDDEHGATVSMAAWSPARATGVTRIGPVYTPPARRGAGYGSAVTAAVSQRILDQGCRPILFADLRNKTSNAIYRAIGFEAIDEMLLYRFST
jgi:GNAT superfamily N-acetyltransferase